MEYNGIKIDKEPIDTTGTIGTVESYHKPLRAAHEKIWLDIDWTTTDQ